MITLITGTPGSGKTLYAVEMIMEYLKQGRVVYADIDGLNIPNVLLSPDDWRDTPDGSVVFYDECQRKYPSTGKGGNATDERIVAMETHRHTGHDLIFITQAPTFLHVHIRKLCGKHHHIYRAMGLKGATVFTWEIVVGSPNDKKEQLTADTKRWSYPKKLFEKYQSATIHTHKFSMPRKIAVLITSALIIFALVFYFAKDNFLAKTITGESNQAQPLQTIQTINSVKGDASPDAVLINTTYNNKIIQDIAQANPVIKHLSGCVSGTSCRCWDTDGNVVDLKDNICRIQAQTALPINIKHEYAQGQTALVFTPDQQPERTLTGSDTPVTSVGGTGRNLVGTNLK